MFNSRELPHELKFYVANINVLQNQLDSSSQNQLESGLTWGEEERERIEVRKEEIIERRAVRAREAFSRMIAMRLIRALHNHLRIIG